MTNKVPNIRFKGFTDDWEQRKLSDIADRFDNLRVPITASERKSGDTPYYGANGIQDYVEGFTHDGEFILVAEDGANDLKNYPVQYVNGKVWVNNHAHVLQGKNTITDNKFLMNSIKNFNIEPFLVGGGRAKLNADVMMKLNILLPTFDEQEKIGSFFKQLDDTIALHQRKCEQTKELKKFMLQKMFPKKGEKNPEIRFPGFTDAWEQRKLIDYLEVSKEKNKNEVFGKEDVLSVSGDYGIVNQIEFQGRSFAGASVAPYGIVDTGDIVYTKSPLKSNPYGIIKANKGKAGIVSTLYAVYKPLDNVCSDFVQIYFEQDARMNNYMHPLVNKGAKNDMKVSDVNALKGEVCFPSKDEQIKISEHFANLDHLITLHQRKCEQLKELKKFMLQNMFPKKG